MSTFPGIYPGQAVGIFMLLDNQAFYKGEILPTVEMTIRVKGVKGTVTNDKNYQLLPPSRPEMAVWTCLSML